MPAKIGQLLSHLTRHDIEEILQEQVITGRPFGQIAVELGLCQPQEVWTAWCKQLIDYPQEIDLDQIGIDSQALSHVPGNVARSMSVLPIRCIGETLVLATTAANHARASAEIGNLLDRDVRFVLITDQELADALDESYLPLAVSA